MTEQPNKRTSPQVKVGLITELARTARLVWRLLRDHRIATATKLIIPGLVGAYLLMPIDLLPDVVPLVGQIDDVMLLALGAKLFIDMCPPDVVDQHRADLRSGKSSAPPASDAGEVVDAEYHVIE